MKLQFKSDFVENNFKLDKIFIEKIKKGQPKLAFIPSQTDKTRQYFNFVKKRYSKLGISKYLYFDLDKEYKESGINELTSCDIIFLSGGNTFYFLKSIIKHDFKKVLIDFAYNGGAIIGQSAGALIMTEKINLAHSGDKNNTGLNDFKGLNLVDFQINCHLNWDKEGLLNYTKTYSKENHNTTIYAFADGEGIVVNENKIEFVGNVLKIKNGNISNA